MNGFTNVIKTGAGKLHTKRRIHQIKVFTKRSWGRYKALDRKKKVIVTTSAVVTSLIVIVLIASSGSGNPHSVDVQHNERPNPILVKLNGIENQIAVLQNQQSKTGVSQQQLASLNRNLMNLRDEVSNLQSTNPQNVSQIRTIVASSNQSISNQLSDIKRGVDALKQQEAPKHFLPASALPWPISGVDVRNYQPVVVRGDGYPAMMLHEARDGWRVVKIQFQPAEVEFQSIQNPTNYVRVEGQN